MLLLSFGTFAQTVTPNPGPYTPMAQKYQYPWIKTTGGVWNTGKFVQIDSAQFSGITYVPDAPVDDSSTQAANTRWIRQNISPGTPGTPTSVWQFLGNYSPTDPTLGRIGFIDSFPLSIITDNEIRITIPDNGIKRSAGLANKVLMIDTITKNVYYADAGGSGGGIDSTTLSDSLAGFIPLSGPRVGKPVTGDLKFDALTDGERRIYSGDLTGAFKKIYFDDDGQTFGFENKNSIGESGMVQIAQDGVTVSATGSSPYGMNGMTDFSANYDLKTYVQKLYVDRVADSLRNYADSNSIPITGTLVGKPITGDLEFDNGTISKILKGNTGDGYIEFKGNTGQVVINDASGGAVTVNGININGRISDPMAIGIVGGKNYSSEYNDRSFIQKVYADSLLALKLNISDTTNKWVQSVANNAGGDSLIVIKNGVRTANKYPSGAAGWGLTGNAGTGASNFIGTTDNQPLRFRVNNTEQILLNANGNITFSGLVTGSSSIIGQSFITSSGGIATQQKIVLKGGTVGTSYYGLATASNQTSAATSSQIHGGYSFILDGAQWYSGVGLNFFTTPGPDMTSIIPIERMRISSNGNVGIGTTANATALLDVTSTTKGVLLPRLTTTQRDAITSPATGLTVYNTTTNTNDTYLGGAWVNDLQSASPSFTGLLSGVGTTQTGSSAVGTVSISQTLNTTGNVDVVSIDVANTASGVATNLTNWKVGGSSVASVSKAGYITSLGYAVQGTRFYIAGSGYYQGGGSTGILRLTNIAESDFNRLQFGGGTSSFPAIARSSNNILIKDAADGVTASLGVGVASVVASSKLEVASTTQGFLPPRMTTTQKNAIASPATGLMVFDTTLAKLCVYTGAAWETITSL